MKSKAIKLTLCLLLILATLTSCGTTATVTPTPDVTETVQTTQEQPETPEDTGPVNRPAHASDEYLIYQSLPLEGWFVFDLEYAKSYHEFDILLGLTMYDYETETAPKREGYTYEHTEYFKDMSSQESLPLDEIHDYYTDEYGCGSAFIRGTDIIVAQHSAPHKCTLAEMTDEKCKEFAEKYLYELINQDSKKYKVTDCISIDSTNQKDVIFTGYIEGYPTGDEIEITVCSKCGFVQKYSMPQANRYNKATEEVSRRRVEYSYEQLKAKVDAMNINVTNYGEPKIVLSNTGEYFLEVKVTHVDSFSEYSDGDKEVTFNVYYKY